MDELEPFRRSLQNGYSLDSPWRVVERGAAIMDELECFRRAAELGCPDFKIEKGHLFFIQAEWGDHGSLGVNMEEFGEIYVLPFPMSKRINRYAAAVCAEWWAEQKRKRLGAFLTEPDQMIDLCRAFGRKHGGA